jgi:hypothetical protein
MIVEATPDASHANMELELEISGCTLENPGGSFFCPDPVLSTPTVGPASVSYSPWGCEVSSVFPAYVGDTCNVKVRPVDFGSAGAPATVDITIRGETEVPTSSGDIETTTTIYFEEGQNFRWIYDLDDDNVLITPVQGRCEWSDPGTPFLLQMPYTYQYQGSPTYQGLDCCTWQIGSTTGVTGTGQAIFYISVDSSLPANQPGDLDLDGIKDLCDNCQTVPNGPLLGTCLSGSLTGSACLSDQECINGPCSLAQDDVDRDGDGDACVPEPGLGAMLASGLVALAALERRRRRR